MYLRIYKNKSEYLILGNEDKQDLGLEQYHIEGIKIYAFMWELFITSMEISERLKKGRQVTQSSNPVLWDKDVRREMKKTLDKNILETVVTYGAEVLDIRS